MHSGEHQEIRPPLLPFTEETALQKVEAAQRLSALQVGQRRARLLRTKAPGGGVLESWCLELELLRSEILSEPFSCGLDELGAAYDPLDLGSGAGAAHVIFLEYLLQGHVIVHAVDDVPHHPLLARGEGGASPVAEEALPKGPSLAHTDL